MQYQGAYALTPAQAYAQNYLQQQEANAQLRKFWDEQRAEIEEVGNDPAEFKNHQLPLARIKKVRKEH